LYTTKTTEGQGPKHDFSGFSQFFSRLARPQNMWAKVSPSGEAPAARRAVRAAEGQMGRGPALAVGIGPPHAERGAVCATDTQRIPWARRQLDHSVWCPASTRASGEFLHPPKLTTPLEFFTCMCGADRVQSANKRAHHPDRQRVPKAVFAPPWTCWLAPILSQ